MADEQDGAFRRLAGMEEDFPCHFVEVVRRLVEDDDVRLGAEADAESHAHALPTREMLDLRHHLVRIESHRPEHRARLGFHHVQLFHDDIERPGFRLELRMLIEIRELHARSPCDFSRRHRLILYQAFEKGGLARSVSPEKHDMLA